MTGDERAAWLARQRAAGCTCPELYAGLNPTGVLNRSENCRLHGLGTASWERYHEVASERLRAAWAEVHAARAAERRAVRDVALGRRAADDPDPARPDPTPDGADPGA